MESTQITASLKAAEAAIAAGQYKDALQHCKAALKADKKSTDALVLIGKAAFHINEYDQAELAYRRALEITSDLLPAWEGLADLFATTNNYKGQVEANEQLLQHTTERDPNEKVARMRLAQAYATLDDYDKAIHQYKQILDTTDASHREQRLELLCQMANVLLKRDETIAAQEIQARLRPSISTLETSPPSSKPTVDAEQQQQSPPSKSTLTRTAGSISCLELDILAAQAANDADNTDGIVDISVGHILAEIAQTAPPSLVYLPYREEYIRRCLLRIFHAPPRSTERQIFRLEALRECAGVISQGGSCSPLGYEAAVWLLEEEEEIKGGQVSVGGQEVGGTQALAGGIQAGAEGHIGSGRQATAAYAAENFSRRMYHQFPTNPTAQVLLALMLRRHAVHDKRPISQSQRLRLERLLDSAMGGKEEGSHIDCASGFKALAELQYENRHYDAACATVHKGLRWLQQRRDRGHEALTQVALGLRLILAKSLRRLDKLDDAERHFKSLAGWVTEGEAAFAEMSGSAPISIHQQALRGISQVALARGDVAAARSQYERILGKAALGRGPSEHWAHGDYGWLLYRDGDYRGAREQLEHAIEIAEAEGCAVTDSQLAEHRYRLGEVYWKLKGRYRSDKQFAYQQFLEGAKVEGHAQAPALAALGRYFDIVEKRPDQAQRCYKKALSIDPEVDVAGDGLCALIASTQKNSNTSTETIFHLCKEILSKAPHAFWAWKRLGIVLLGRNKYSEAVTAFQSALRINTNDAPSWELLGAAYQPLGRLTAALKAYGRSLEIDSMRVYSLVQSGSLSLSLGNIPGALEYYERALHVSSTCEKKNKDGTLSKTLHPSALLGAAEALTASAMIDLRLGALYSASCSLGKARKYAEMCARGNSTLVSAWKRLGDVLLLYRYTDPVPVLNTMSTVSDAVIAAGADVDVATTGVAGLCIDDDGRHGHIHKESNILASDSTHAPTTNATTTTRTTTTTATTSLKLKASFQCRSHALDQSRRAYTKALHLNPSLSSAWHDVAATFYHQYHLARAYRQKLPVLGTFSSAHSPIATTQLSLPTTTTAVPAAVFFAERVLRGALRLEPSSPHLWRALGAASLDPSTKEYSFSRSLQLDPRCSTAWTALARLYIDAGEKGLAERCLQQGRSQDPTSAFIWEAMSALARNKGKNTLPEEGEYAEHALGLGAGFEGLSVFAESALMKKTSDGSGDGDDASRHRSSSISPQLPPQFLPESSSLVRKTVKDSGLVYAAARKAAELAPHNATALNTYGLACEMKGDYSGAIEAFSSAMDLLTEERETNKARELAYATATAATTDSSKSDVPPLVVYPEMTRDGTPIDQAVQLNLGRALCAAGRYTDAIALYNEVEREKGLDGRCFASLSRAVAKGALHDMSGAKHAVDTAFTAAGDNGDCILATVEVSMLVLLSSRHDNINIDTEALASDISLSNTAIMNALDVLEENLPRLEESGASLDGVARLWRIAMSASVMNKTDATAATTTTTTTTTAAAAFDGSLEKKVWNGAHAWAHHNKYPNDAQLFADLLSLRATHTADKQRSSSRVLHCKAFHLQPTSERIRIMLCHAALAESSRRYGTAVLSLLNDTDAAKKSDILTMGEKTKNEMTTTAVLLARSRLAAKTAALLSLECVTACISQGKALLLHATAVVHVHPYDALCWYYAAVVATHVATCTGSKSDFSRALSWCKKASRKTERKSREYVYSLIYTSECLLRGSGDNDNDGDNDNGKVLAALDVAQRAAEYSSALHDPDVHAMALRQLARCYWMQCEVDRAENLLKESHELRLTSEKKI